MKYFYKVFTLLTGLLSPVIAFADMHDHMGDGMMYGMGSTGIFMSVIWILLIVLLVLGILALIKYLKGK